jgi:hypothetical protein
MTPDPTTEVFVEESPSPEVASGTANVQLQKIHLSKWKNVIDNWEYQIVAEVKNTGTGWADTYASSDFTILAKDGSVTDTDTAYFGVPRFLAPGASGYLLGEGQIDGGSSSDITKVEIEPTWTEADGPLAGVEPSKVKMKSGYYGDGVDVSGLVKNTGTDKVDANVFAILVGSGGKILGYNSTRVDGIGGGKSKGFVAAGERNLKKSLVKKVMVYAFDSAS